MVMRMYVLSLVSTLCLVSSAFAVSLSYDDFVPPAQGGPQEVRGKVKIDRGQIVAENAQDGLNYALQTLLHEDEGEGVKDIVVPSGFAVISAATEPYTTYENRNATLLSKRAAYTRAMVRAQKLLVENFEGSLNSCERAVTEHFKTLDSGADESQANLKTRTGETCNEQVQGVLAGYVVYYVRDNVPEDKSVTIALASSTKTRTAIRRIGGAVVHSQNPRQAWGAILAEIASAVVPPVGVRLIHHPVTGETIVIGFGSAIVRQNRDATIGRKLATSAKRQAQIRANSALVSFLNGDNVYWTGGFDESQIEEAKQFRFTSPPAPDASNPPASRIAGAVAAGQSNVEVFDKTRHLFLDVLKSSEDYQTITKGQLPPGVKKKSFLDEHGDWALAIAVYAGSMTAQAEQAGRENRDANGKLDAYGKGASGARSGARPEAGSRPMGIYGGVNEGADNPKGPTGWVTKDSGL